MMNEGMMNEGMSASAHYEEMKEFRNQEIVLMA
jgi:hypothetical protein